MYSNWWQDMMILVSNYIQIGKIYGHTGKNLVKSNTKLVDKSNKIGNKI